MMPELYLADALGATGKPIMRVHPRAVVGGSTAVVATHLHRVADSRARLTLAFREASEGDTNFAFRAGGAEVWARGATSRPAHPRLHPSRSGRAPAYGRPDGRW